MPGLTVLPTRTAASIGREKVELAAAADDVHYLLTAEWNRAADAIVAMAARLGLGDGTTAGSIEALLRSINTPSQRSTLYPNFADFDDFGELLSTTPNRWILDTGASGSGAIIAADTAPADTRGFGWATLTTANLASSYADLYRRHNLVRGDHNPVFRARVRLPTTFANATTLFGFRELSDLSYAKIGTNASGEWTAAIKSNAGASTSSLTTIPGVTAPSAGGIYDLRIELSGGQSVSFYMKPDGGTEELVASADIVSHPNSLPDAADVLSWGARIDRVASTSAIWVDYIDVRGEAT